MGWLQQLEKWSITHHPRWLVLFRAVLGIALFLKGISFLNDMISLETMIAQSSISHVPDWITLIITWAHLLGGFLIIIGLLTRWAVLLQIPILLGAVIIINLPRGIFAPGSEFGFSLVVLLLLIFFLIEGGGPLSLDNYFKKHPK